MVIRETEGVELDWASELLLLTHEPLRRDMLEMQRALSTRYFGELPEGWRVRAFFRFFTAWCSLVSQQHATEVTVYYDWLASPTGKVKGEHRQELLSYHRAIELELLAISRLEKKIIDELAGAADWHHAAARHAARPGGGARRAGGRCGRARRQHHQHGERAPVQHGE